MTTLPESLEVVEVSEVETWASTVPPNASSGQDTAGFNVRSDTPFALDNSLNAKVSLWHGDLVSLACDVIVNSTSEQFSERTALSRRIFHYSGDLLVGAVAALEGCKTGEAKLTPAFDLPSQHIVHTVGPRYNTRYRTAAENALHSCYRGCLQAAKEARLSTVGFCVINSDSKGYPREEGAHIAFRTVRRFLEHFPDDFERIIFVSESGADRDVYQRLLPLYFPRTEDEVIRSRKLLPADIGNEWGETVIEERVIRISSLLGSSSEEEDDEAEGWLGANEANTKEALTKFEPSKDTGPALSAADRERLRDEEVVEARYLAHLEKARTADLKEFDQMGVLYHSGHDAQGRPIVVCNPCRLPRRITPQLMDRFLMFLIRVLDPLVNSEYTVVYFHSHFGDRDKPDFSWLRSAYDIFSWKYSRNLHRVHVVHHTFWLRIVCTFLKAFSDPGFFEKLVYLDSLSTLFEVVDKTQLKIIPEVFDYDRIENGTLWAQTDHHKNEGL